MGLTAGILELIHTHLEYWNPYRWKEEVRALGEPPWTEIIQHQSTAKVTVKPLKAYDVKCLNVILSAFNKCSDTFQDANSSPTETLE